MNSKAVQTIPTQQPQRHVPNDTPDSPVHAVMEQIGRMVITDDSSTRNEVGNFYNNPSNVDFELMKLETERLKTFFAPPAWSTSFINPDDCASAGFFYIHDGDKVQCAFCRGVAGEWRQGDVPLVEHRRHFPRCPFVCNLPVGNVPKNQTVRGDVVAGQEVASSGSSSSGSPAEVAQLAEFMRGVDICGPVSNRGAQSKMGSVDDVARNLSIRPVRGPYNLNMVTEWARLKSFQHSNWPPSVEQEPEKLAQAGFYYCGRSDHVKCFYCGGGLRNWEGGEDPWVEHAKWFPRCIYLHLNKGDAFIESVAGPNFAEIPSIPANLMSNNSDEEEPSPSTSQSSEPNPNPTEAEVEIGARTATAPGSDPCPEDVPSCSSSGNSSGDEDTAPSPDLQDLEDEIRKLRDARVCKVCMDKEVSVVFLPCGHLISCTSCATAFKDCALCRQPIKAIVRTYMS